MISSSRRSSSSRNPAQEPLQIRQDTKFYRKLLSKESSIANPSFRVYYGVASGAVPFTWESQPGTPKHTFHNPKLPPLTPPPSYHFNLHSKKSTKKHNKPHNFITCILPRLALRRSQTPRASPASFSSSSVSSSSSFPPAGYHLHRRCHSSSPRMSLGYGGDDEDFNGESPTSTLCLGLRHGGARWNAFLSIVGHGSRQGTAV